MSEVAMRKRILLIEDDPDDATLLQRGLQQTSGEEFEPIVVNDLQSALDLLAQHSVDLVLLDLGLPDVASEFAGLTAIVDLYPHVPVVVITGEADADELAPKAADMGAEDCVFKEEADVGDLLRAMRCALNRARFRRVQQQKLRNESEQTDTN